MSDYNRGLLFFFSLAVFLLASFAGCCGPTKGKVVRLLKVAAHTETKVGYDKERRMEANYTVEHPDRWYVTFRGWADCGGTQIRTVEVPKALFGSLREGDDFDMGMIPK